MVTHQAVSRPGRFGGTLTTTLCGRMNKQCSDGMNSGIGEEVTCKFCLRAIEALKTRRANEATQKLCGGCLQPMEYDEEIRQWSCDCFYCHLCHSDGDICPSCLRCRSCETGCKCDETGG